MSAKYDTESLITELVALLQANLNPKIDALNAEKADDAPIYQVPNEAYFFQDINHERAPAYSVILFYGLEDPKTTTEGPHVMEDHTLHFIICVKETAETSAFTTKLLRYTRAVQEVFQDGWINNRNRCKLAISAISPTKFSADGVAGSWRCVGVKVETTLA